MFFLVLIREDCVTEVLLDCALSTAAVSTTIVPTLVLDFIKRMMSAISPIKQINKATPRQTVEIRADLDSELPVYT